MSTVDKLARTKPKGNASSRSSNRFEDQINRSLNLLLKMEDDQCILVHLFFVPHF